MSSEGQNGKRDTPKCAVGCSSCAVPPSPVVVPSKEQQQHDTTGMPPLAADEPQLKKLPFPSSNELAKKLDEKQRAVFEEWEQSIAKALEAGVDVVDAGRAIKVDIPLTISYEYLNKMQKRLMLSGYSVHAWDEFGNAIRFWKAEDDETSPPSESIWEEARRSWDDVVVKAKELFCERKEKVRYVLGQDSKIQAQQQSGRVGKMHISIPLRAKTEIRGERDSESAPRHLPTVLFWMVVKFLDTAPVWKVFFGPLTVSALICPVWLHRVIVSVVFLALLFRFWRWASSPDSPAAPVPPPSAQQQQKPTARGVHAIHQQWSHQVTITQNGDYLEVRATPGCSDAAALSRAAEIFERSAKRARQLLACLDDLDDDVVDHMGQSSVPSAPPAQQQQQQQQRENLEAREHAQYAAPGEPCGRHQCWCFAASKQQK